MLPNLFRPTSANTGVFADVNTPIFHSKLPSHAITGGRRPPPGSSAKFGGTRENPAQNGVATTVFGPDAPREWNTFCHQAVGNRLDAGPYALLTPAAASAHTAPPRRPDPG
jgi:hypothetical protein